MSNSAITIESINNRYSGLAESSCCLSCGGAINFANVKEGEVCLDLGSGRGNDVMRMAESAGKTGFVYGIDVSDGMLRKAEKTAQRLGIPNVQFIKSELEHLELESGSVDVIISNCTINHAADKQKAWNEIYRVLKKGGRFTVSDIYSLQPVPDEYRNDPQAVAECWAGSVTREEYLQQLKAAGFDSVSIIEESAPYPKGEIEVSSWTIAGTKS